MSVSLCHTALTKKTRIFHTLYFLMLIFCGVLFREIKLLTLVQDSSMEQKLGLVSVCKVKSFFSILQNIQTNFSKRLR